MLIRPGAVWLILLTLHSLCLHAQPAAKTGTLSGTIFDASGDPVPLAEVTLVIQTGQTGQTGQAGLRRSVLASETGRYFAFDLPAGSYTLVVTAPAFGEQTSTAVVKEGEIVDASVVLTITPLALDPPALYRSYLDSIRDNAEIRRARRAATSRALVPMELAET